MWEYKTPCPPRAKRERKSNGTTVDVDCITFALQYSLSQMLRNTVKDLTGTQEGRHGQHLDDPQSRFIISQPAQKFFFFGWKRNIKKASSSNQRVKLCYTRGGPCRRQLIYRRQIDSLVHLSSFKFGGDLIITKKSSNILCKLGSGLVPLVPGHFPKGKKLPGQKESKRG
jgi:hypothetical protein